MSRIDEVIGEFGHFIELSDLSFNEEGVIDLEIETIGELCLEREADGILVYLLREYPQANAALCRRALALCQPSENTEINLYTGLIGDTRLLFALRIEEELLDFQRLNEAFKLLEELHNRLA